MTNLGRFIVGFIILVIIAVAALVYYVHRSDSATVSTTATSTPQTYGMSEYTDATYGFTFWYPSSLQVTASSTESTSTFPGGTAVELLTIGSQGGAQISVVQSASSTITDEPVKHASPIAQTKYFYNVASSTWMVAYPEGSPTGGKAATTTADISKQTVGGLPMLPSGARFDTTIIPLSATEFLVVQDGGGSSFTSQLAATLAPAGATIDPTALSNALQAEASAYSRQ